MSLKTEKTKNNIEQNTAEKKKQTTMTTKDACDMTHDLPLPLCVCVYASQAVMLFSPVYRFLFIYARV